MKYVQINTVCNGSTGKVMRNIQKKAIKDGYETLSFYGRRKGYTDLPCEKIGGFFSFWFHVFLTTIFDLQGRGSYFKTKKLVNRLKEENPDIIHLHNIHGYYLNYKILFLYLKNEYKGKVYWTFHDCWPFTGHCPYFSYVNCKKWEKQCFYCPNKKKYPTSLLLDRSYKNYLEKKEYFTGISKLTIITPSNWLNRLVKKSFLKKYPVITMENTIAKNIFKPTKDRSILEKYSIPNKKLLLGVANIWEPRKGLEDFCLLSSQISDDYIIVLVGVSKKQKRKLKSYKNIVSILRTENQIDLVKLYSICEWFINPTYEDNYPTVNLEAKACGAKIICYDTGGCSEQLKTEDILVEKVYEKEKNVQEIIKNIL